MTGSIDRTELQDLASGHCTGTLNEAQSQRLAAALRDDALARLWFIEYMDLHAALAWECSSAADLDAAIVARSASTQRRPFARGGRALRSLVATPQRVALSVATVAICGFLLIMAYTPATTYYALGWRNDPEKTVAAHLSAAMDCQWEPARELRRGAALVVGEKLTLAEGAAEVTFLSGATVTLTGPATLTIEAPSRGSLAVGKLAARVPHEARGFTIATPGSTIVDLGTEFGVSVPPRDEASGRPLGKEELHVFDGEVEVEFRNAALAPRRLLAGEALRYASRAAEQTGVGGVEQLASSQRARFPRLIDAEEELTIAEPLPVAAHPPVTRGLVLWLAADGALRCSSTGGLAMWDDMLAGDNRAAHSAQQTSTDRRPTWVADAIQGRPAIRFDGDDYLALPGPDKLGISGAAYEIYIVARSTSPGAQFLIAGGTEEFEVHINGASGETGARFIPTGFFGGRGASDVGTQGAFSDGRAHLFAARVLPEQDFCGVLTVDGQTSSDPTGDDARGYSDTALRLGMRTRPELGFVGEMAEVLIYRQSLTPSERDEVAAYLAEKYHLSLK